MIFFCIPFRIASTSQISLCYDTVCTRQLTRLWKTYEYLPKDDYLHQGRYILTRVFKGIKRGLPQIQHFRAFITQVKFEVNYICGFTLQQHVDAGCLDIQLQGLQKNPTGDFLSLHSKKALTDVFIHVKSYQDVPGHFPATLERLK